MMTPGKAHDLMKKIAHSAKDDPEAAHVLADQLMCEILRASGYYDTADLFEKMTKHYG